jgi:DNA-binding LacI/PurR family transcriptional regulator
VEKPSRNQRVTIRTVAEDAGVSVAAVSKVLRDAYGVSEALRGKVRASIERLGYRPHAAARGMRGQTYTLGFLLPDMRNPFFADIMMGVNAALERTQYKALIGVSDSNVSIDKAMIEEMIDRQMDGVMLIGPRIAASAISPIAARIPTTIIAYHTTESINFDTVNNDDIHGAELVIQHLVETGYKRITFLGLELEDEAGAMVTTKRETGYRRAMQRAGLDKHITIVRAGQTPRDMQNAARHLLQGRNRPDAIFCWTDVAALEVLSMAKELGVRVPDELGVVGYDNTFFCDLAQNALTSIDQSGQVLGLQAARLLIERIAGRQKSEHFVVAPRLVVRASSAGPKK